MGCLGTDDALKLKLGKGVIKNEARDIGRWVEMRNSLYVKLGFRVYLLGSG